MFIFTIDQEFWSCELMGCDHSLGLKKILMNLICFIFVIDQELWARELIGCIMGCDHSLGRKDILKFVYYFMILFLIVYIFIISTM
jgi:hypothetical protein